MSKVIPKNKILAVAAAVAPWDESELEARAAAPRRAATESSEFEFNQPGESAAAELPAVAPAPTAPAPAPVAPPRKLKPAGFLHHDNEQPGLHCSATERSRFVASGNWPGPAPERDHSCSNPLLRTALKSPAVKAALVNAKAEQKSFLKVSAETAPLTEIEPQKLALRNAIDAASDVEEITKLRDAAALLDSPEAEAARQSGLRLVKNAHIKLEAALGALLETVSAELSNQVSEIEAAEVELFDKFGFVHETTPLMGKLRSIQTRVKHHKDMLTLARTATFSRHTIGDGSHVLETFGS